MNSKSEFERSVMIIGVDPGESTGAFIIDLYPSLVDPPYVIESSWRAQGPPENVLASLTTELEAARLNGVHVALAVERFTVMPATSRMTQQSTPQHVIGRLQTLASEYGATFLLQTPGDVKKMCSNAKLRQFGFWSTGKMVGCPDANDVNDAARHAVFALAFTRASAYDALLRRTIPAQRS
jgi:hypothetical protein